MKKLAPGILLALAMLVFSVLLTRRGARAANGATARLSVTIIEDATGQPTAARVRLTDVAGAPVPPPPAAIGVMYFNLRETRYAAQPDGAFYVEGGFDAELKPGRHRLAVTKGTEFLAQEQEIEIEMGRNERREIRLKRWANSAQQGWWSADEHIHLRRSPRENAPILSWIAAEDLHVGVLLQWGDLFGTHDHQHAFGAAGVYQVGDRLIASGQEEPRSHELGHTLTFGADEFVRFADTYYDYGRVFDRVHELHGLTGYAHQAMTANAHRGLTMDALAGKVDFLELLQFSLISLSTAPLLTAHYYTFLDLGCKLTATAGSDFPWLGKKPVSAMPQIGNVRFYTRLDVPLTHERWREAVRAGHTYVSSGPLLEFTVNGKLPGDELDVPPGSRVHVVAKARGHATQVPLADLQIIVHGEVVHTVTARDAGQGNESLSLEADLPLEHGAWIAARARAGAGQVAHTTPVYVRVDGGGFHNPKTVQQSLDLCEAYLRELEEDIAKPSEKPENNAWRHRKLIEHRIAETREVIRKLREKLSSR